MAEVVLRAQLDKADLAGKVVVDSAGTGDWHIGDTMNGRARDQLALAGYDGDAHRARQIDAYWLPQRDLFLAMDAANLRDLRAFAPAADAGRIRLFGEIADLGGRDVPDPYYGTDDDFAAVLTLLETGMANLVTQLREIIPNGRG